MTITTSFSQDLSPLLIRYEGKPYFAFTNEQVTEIRKITELSSYYQDLVANYKLRFENYEAQLKEQKYIIGNQEGIITDYSKSFALQSQQHIRDMERIAKLNEAFNKQKKRKKVWKVATFVATGGGVLTYFLLK